MPISCAISKHGFARPCWRFVRPCSANSPADQAALARRVEVAAGMLARAADERVIRLHPEDLALVGARLPEDWHFEPDPGLERGALRVEGAAGGVEDSPAIWLRALSEALRYMLRQHIAASRARARKPIQEFAPRRYGLVTACDGGLLEVSGLSLPIGAQCRITHGPNKDGAAP